MYTTCTFCYGHLGTNPVLETFPVARRVAFDPAKGCLWAVCPACARWNLVPLEERWEGVDECERRYRRTSLRYSSGNIGLAWLQGDLELIRIGPALRPEVAAWRYGRTLTRRVPLRRSLVAGASAMAAGAMRQLMLPTRESRGNRARSTLLQMFAGTVGGKVIDVVRLGGDDGSPDVALAVVRLRHLMHTRLVRPEPGLPWSLVIPHDGGEITLHGEHGIRSVARMLAVLNGTMRGAGFPHDVLEAAARKVDESAIPDSYFNRVLTLALRSSWGRGDAHGGDDAAVAVSSLEVVTSETERLAWRLTGRTFWGRGGIGSDPATSLLDVPLVDRVALEMAAHEETERRALDGELAELAAAWREAAEIASIAEALG